MGRVPRPGHDGRVSQALGPEWLAARADPPVDRLTVRTKHRLRL